LGGAWLRRIRWVVAEEDTVGLSGGGFGGSWRRKIRWGQAVEGSVG
jgi:hypothetical protein